MNHLIQIGILGSIGRFRSVDGRHYRRSNSVVCRTERGLEVGTILSPESRAMEPSTTDANNVDGEILRQVTPDDQLILTRIDKFRDKAFHSCQKLIHERGLTATLVDVEHLFDGQSLYFYFLGEVSDEVTKLTSELAEAYEAKVKFRKFSQVLAEGCGPECGTKDGGCSSDGCSSCSLRSACKTAAPG